LIGKSLPDLIDFKLRFQQGDETVVNLIRIGVMCVAIMAVASPVMAQAQPTGNTYSMNLGAALGTGIVILGAGLGIGRIGGQAVEGMSRQPEAAGSIQTGMLIAAALIEGATFFALIVVIIKG
jgi:F-type H+-transporting ATPase subunit c